MATLPLNTASTDRRFLAALYVLSLLSAASFCLIHESITPLVFLAAGALIAWLLVDSPHGKPLPKLLVNTILVLVAFNFAWEAWDGESFNLMTSLGHFIIGLLICKFFERKSPRDIGQVLILSLLIVTASTMYSSAISFALVLVFYFAILTYTVVLLHLRIQTQAVTEGRRRQPISAVFPTNGLNRLFARDLRLTAFKSMLLLIPFALVVFVMLPRTRGNPLLSRLQGGASFQTGFSEEVRYQDYGHLNESDAIALQVTFSQNGANVGAGIVDPYFRGTTLEIYDAHYGRWSHDRNEDADETLKLDRDGYVLLAPLSQVAQVEPLVQDYELSVRNRDYLFHLAPPLSVTLRNRQEVTFSKNTMVLQSAGRPAPSNYRVESFPRMNGAVYAGDPPRRPPQSDAPTKDIQDLARKVGGDLLPPPGTPLPAEQIPLVAGRFENYLRTNYPYSLEFQRIDRTMEPITDFLLNHKEAGGHCEYFAAAMVMLCRSANIEARMVTGYHGGDFNSLNSKYTVLQRNAHAWAEYWVPGTGWVQSDPSPISTAEAFNESMIARWVREMRQIVLTQWLTNVVTFDNETRQQVMNWLGEILSSYKNLDIFKADFWTRTAAGASTLGIIAAMVYMLRRVAKDRRIAHQLGGGRRYARVSGDVLFLDELLRLVGRRLPGKKEGEAGLYGRRFDQTPQEFVEAAAGALGPAVEDARWLVTTFYGIRFGGAHLTPGVRKQIAQAMRRVREALRRRGVDGRVATEAAGVA